MAERGSRQPARSVSSRLSLIALVVVTAMFGGCAGDRQTEEPIKVALVAIDGATWSVIDPLIAAGELPNMERLIDLGARGVLKSVRPTKSPALWTTIATGVPRFAHGIYDFQQGGKLVSALDRERTAIWQWVSASGREVGFAGWWASWPADPVRGWLVSDRAVRNRWSEWAETSAVTRSTYPETLIEAVRRASILPESLTRDDVAEIVDLNDAEWSEFQAADKPIAQHWLSVFKFSYANQLSYESISLQLLEAGQPDLLGVFLIANDPISHTFWHFFEPDRYEGVDPDEAARLGQAIPNIWRHNDRYLGELLSRLDENTVVMIVSDHGFEASGTLPSEVSIDRGEALQAAEDDVVAIGQSGKHHLDGILVLSGPGIVPGVELDARLVDVAPTVMALLGLPIGDDLHGDVLAEALATDVVSRVRTIPSWEPLVASMEPEGDLELEDPEMLERLRALGYVE